jgi:ATP-dependent RNA helicase DDX3X
MMFSATFPKEARLVAKEYMSTNHIRIRVGRIGSVHVNVTQNVRRFVGGKVKFHTILTKA